MSRHVEPEPKAPNTTRRRASRGRTKDPEVQEYIDRFAKAVTAADVDPLAGMWNVPALVVGETVAPVSSVDEVRQFFGGARE